MLLGLERCYRSARLAVLCVLSFEVLNVHIPMVAKPGWVNEELVRAKIQKTKLQADFLFVETGHDREVRRLRRPVLKGDILNKVSGRFTHNYFSRRRCSIRSRNAPDWLRKCRSVLRHEPKARLSEHLSGAWVEQYLRRFSL